MAHPYLDLISRCRGPTAADWLREQLARISAGDEGAFAGAFAAATRRLGEDPVVLEAPERQRIEAAGAPAPAGWPLDQLARALLLHAALEATPPAAHGARVHALYQRGDNRERAALLQSLSLLPAPQSFLATAVEACRTHVQPVFEAIACENPYPARHFPEPAFNQLVLKALFTGVALARIAGLQERIGSELVRMARDYADERRAAGRDLPADIGTLTRQRPRGAGAPEAGFPT